jgi:hypothetical protein
MNPPADPLPSSPGAATFIPFLVASIALAAAYGASFLLSEHLRHCGFDSSMTGAVISTGILTIIVRCAASLALHHYRARVQKRV